MTSKRKGDIFDRIDYEPALRALFFLLTYQQTVRDKFVKCLKAIVFLWRLFFKRI